VSAASIVAAVGLSGCGGEATAQQNIEYADEKFGKACLDLRVATDAEARGLEGVYLLFLEAAEVSASTAAEYAEIASAQSGDRLVGGRASAYRSAANGLTLAVTGERASKPAGQQQAVAVCDVYYPAPVDGR
jgi:hypothetical protein